MWRLALAGKPQMFLRYIVVVLSSLGITATIVALVIVIAYLTEPKERELPMVTAPATVALLISVVVAVLKAVLIGTMNPLGRKIAITGIGMWVMIWVIGWCWYLAMNDGLDAFTGEVRAAAERALNQAHCSRRVWFEPTAARIFKDADGQFHVLGHTWWGIPSRCH